MIITSQQQHETAQVENLLDVIFGEQRHQKSSYIVRRGVKPVAGLSFVLRHGQEIIGSLRFWPVYLQDSHTCKIQKVLLLGPLAVLPMLQGQGLGVALLKKGICKAKFQGYQRIFLVGDHSYYGKVGFKSALPNIITMPDGKNADRMMVLDLCPQDVLPDRATLLPYFPLDRVMPIPHMAMIDGQNSWQSFQSVSRKLNRNLN